MKQWPLWLKLLVICAICIVLMVGIGLLFSYFLL